MFYELNLQALVSREIYPLGEAFRGISKTGEELSFTNDFMQKNGRPLLAVSGELHFSRLAERSWEDALIKMKMGGIQIVSTYVFWNHHEEQEGSFCFLGRCNLRKFVCLCQKHGLSVILRVGPFCHGEVRNGGIPDWMYGKPFEVRSLQEGFLQCVRRWYQAIGKQTEGLYFSDGGPIIGVQLDNEYMHSSAPWEMTTGVSNEWLPVGEEGTEYLLRLKELAAECGLLPAFYTATAWGGAAVPENVLPLWGGYAFRPWIFYSYQGEHPATEEYVYQDYHRDGAVCTDDFQPPYRPETRPYACCEMGGGMTCCYNYRFQLPYKSVDALANIKLGSGCNFLGYYMFHGGSNPVDKNGMFLNEGQVPKISYDYQAAIGEFGQVRESYRRLKCIHLFAAQFGDRLCGLQTVLPDGASDIQPKDAKPLRFAVRTDGRRGFLFLNNYQDHFELPDRAEDTVVLQLEQETLTWKFGIASGENAILPFHFDLGGIDLVRASAQPLVQTNCGGEETAVFFVPDGMQGEFVFEAGVTIDGCEKTVYRCGKQLSAERFTVEKGQLSRTVLVLSRQLAEELYRLEDGRLLFTKAALLADADGIRLESPENGVLLQVYPANGLDENRGLRPSAERSAEWLGAWIAETAEKNIPVEAEQTAAHRYVLRIPEHAMDGLKEAILTIDYIGDIGNAFIDGRLIHDNFANGAAWELGLKEYEEELRTKPLVLYLAPLREGTRVKAETAMAGRSEETERLVSKLNRVWLRPVYEIPVC